MNTFLRFSKYSILMLFIGFASPVFAEPVVSGNTFSWPDNGWYQVQDASTFQEICSGGRECLVNNGNYNVINHSTGSRWESISVPGDVVETPAPEISIPVSVVTVEGATISWPDDGWYQVQSASTYATTCSGGSSCIVGPGTYIVINHTSGERFENIVVGSDSTTDTASETFTDSRTSSWSIEGNTIHFLNSGWFQVQREGSLYDYSIVCEGQTSCAVEAGRYQIINHTTGEVWQGVGVGISNLYWSQTLFVLNMVQSEKNKVQEKLD